MNHNTDLALHNLEHIYWHENVINICQKEETTLDSVS